MKVNFYVLEEAMELVVRQILFLMIALEPKEKLGLIEKARLWMEVYGNTLVRCSTAKYVLHKMGQIRSLVSDQIFLKKRMPQLDFSLLRYLDLDRIEEIAHYFQMNNGYTISKIWDSNLREQLKENYDYRFSIFDWDYTQKLVKIPGGHRVCSSEYMFWRSSGIAFTWLETEYSVGNPTLVVGICSSGDTLYSFGYLGDMESGPYFAFGTNSEEKPMLERRNDNPVRRATDITERNLQRMFHELEHGYPPTNLYSASIDMGLVLMKPATIDIDKEVTLEFEPDRAQEDYSAIPVPNCKVYFLPGNAMEVFPKKAKYKQFFDVVYVAQNFFKFLNTEIMSMAKPNGCLVIETRKFVIALHKEIGAFGKEVRDKLKEIGWEEIAKYHYKRDDHVVCKRRQGAAENKISENEATVVNKSENEETSSTETAETEEKSSDKLSKEDEFEEKEILNLKEQEQVDASSILEESGPTSASMTDTESEKKEEISQWLSEGKDTTELQLSERNETENDVFTKMSQNENHADNGFNCTDQTAEQVDGGKASGSSCDLELETPPNSARLDKEDYLKRKVSNSEMDNLLNDFQAFNIQEPSATELG